MVKLTLRCGAAKWPGCVENVGNNTKQDASSATAVVASWLNTAVSRRKMLNSVYTAMGVGFASCPSGKVMWSQILAPVAEVATAPAPRPSSPPPRPSPSPVASPPPPVKRPPPPAKSPPPKSPPPPPPPARATQGCADGYVASAIAAMNFWRNKGSTGLLSCNERLTAASVAYAAELCRCVNVWELEGWLEGLRLDGMVGSGTKSCGARGGETYSCYAHIGHSHACTRSGRVRKW